MKKIQIILSLLFITIAYVSCDPNDDNSTSDDNFLENFGNSASRSFIGQIVDTDNHPLQGVTVKIGSSTTQTDINGVFIINGANVYERFAYITATKVGYIDGSRSMVPTSGKNNVKIMLLPNTPVQTVQSGVGSEVALPSGTKVVFDGAFEDANGNDYSGAVQVALFHLLPSDENISKLMPGMLYAQTETNQQAALETYGMINVELRGSGGQKLNIKKGHTAEITLQIDDSQIATAPSTIPLWHFDEERGYWKEDGVATKLGTKYVGEVSHFSWWNCDIPNSSILLTFNFVDANGNPLSNLYINILNPSGFHASGSTDSNGQLSGILPANQVLIVNVYSSFYSCGGNNILFSTTVGPFTTDTVLPNIIINESGDVMNSNVVGTLLKCDNTPVTNGYVYLSRNGNGAVAAITNGVFSFNEIYCASNTDFTLKGFDIENLQQTDSIAYNFTAPITNIGNLQACTAVDEFISYQIDNNPTVFLIQQVSGGASGTGTPNTNGFYLNAYNNDQSGLYIGGTTNVPGIYTTAQFSLEGGSFGYISSTTTNTIQFNLNQVGAIGQYIDMTFSGTYFDPEFGGITRTITGVAHVIRDN
ncbi:hypothetical protein [Flavobacterium sp.]|uniref:hypothetical protein n=1 Tax=Flavobacterium sp. TaxID=239 RepID=UPI0024898FF8|nr:hypothetical protein [Flavobacterium sp.]MDI1317472.1 hypothetical protein [Flavobacterium sp.]